MVFILSFSTVALADTITEHEREELARMLYGEDRGGDWSVQGVMRKAAVIQVVLNRLDEWGGKLFGGSSAIVRKNQFHGYDRENPVQQWALDIVHRVCDGWEAEQMGEENAWRPLPANYLYFAAELAEKEVEMLDAPVSGGEPKAIDGTLAFMVGGKQSVFDRYKPLLESMGSSVVYCGDVGAGNTAKLANQIIVACNIQAVAEAFSMVQKAGVDPGLVFQAIKGGLAGSTVMDAKAPMMMEGNTTPGFKIDLHIKDLNNVLDCGHSVGAVLPTKSESGHCRCMREPVL